MVISHNSDILIPIVAIVPFLIPGILSGASFLSGLFGNKKKAQQQTTTSTSTPAPLSPEYSALQAAIMPNIMKRLSAPAPTLPAGYETGGIDTINQTFDLAGQNSQNDLTSRGLGTSPIASAVMGKHNAGRAGAISNFRTGIPLVEQNMQRDVENENMEMALRALGLSSGNRGTTNATVTQGNESPVAGGVGSLATMLGWLVGSGAFSGGKPTSGKV